MIEDDAYVFSDHDVDLNSSREYITGIYLIDPSSSPSSGNATSTTDFDTKIFKLKLYNDNTFFRVATHDDNQLQGGQSESDA